ncbi:MAG: phage tail tube protein [Firmicutes bacterium]|nr:phage tail tube protein [Bacillota bacterium]
MNKVYTGITGKITIGEDDKKVAYISNWSIDQSNEVMEITELGSRYKKKVSGMKDWTASADGALYFGENTNHGAIYEAFEKGETIKVKFFLYDKESENANGNKDIYFDGEALIESLSIDLSAEDKGNVSISLTGCGKLTLNK